MSGAESSRATHRHGTIAVIGGGCYGSYYLRQLRRARAAGAIHWQRLLIIDRDRDCRVARELRAEPDAAGTIVLVVAEWEPFLARWLDEAAGVGGAGADAIVPSPLMPHLLFDWVLARARARWPDRAVERVALERAPTVPWERASSGGTRYVSFAQWTCPINCIEPRRCPVTRGPRDWSLPSAIRAYADEERRRGIALTGPLIFHCTHRAYGVGMIDVQDVIEADRAVASAGTSGAARVLVGTVSHCHGALDLVAIPEAIGCGSEAAPVARRVPPFADGPGSPIL